MEAYTPAAQPTAVGQAILRARGSLPRPFQADLLAPAPIR